MASEDTLIGNEFRFQLGDGASPEVFTDFCAVAEANGVGEESPLIDTTTLCDLARTYRRGLPDGLEFPLVVNYIVADRQTQQMYEAFKAKQVLNFRLMVADSSPEEYISFSAIVRGWTNGAPSGEKSTMTFTLKITGAVNWVYPVTP